MKWKKIRQINHKERKMANKTADSALDMSEPSTQEDFSETATEKTSKNESTRKNDADLNSGMELLELDFLLSIVENTQGNEENDVTMRRLSFNELLRRGRQSQIDSRSLAVYAVNEGDLYGKDIQCEAIIELTRRTVQHNKK